VIKIVVGFDGRRGGHDALALGRRLGRMLDAELFVICAYPFRPGPADEDGQDFPAADRPDARVLLDEVRELVGRAERPTFVAVPSSNPARALHEVAEGEGAQVIVVGVSERSATGPRSSSTTWEVLRHAPCAVAVAPDAWRERDRPLTRIGIAYDGKPEARAALDAAAALLDQSRPPIDRVEIVHVAGSGRPDAVESDESSRRLAVLGPVRQLELQGDAAAELVEHADELDLLVVGSHDRGALGRLLLGSVSRDVVARARIPVLVRPWSRSHTEGLARAAAFL
jgi:nucleotide-binding universal stress UspA family protein